MDLSLLAYEFAGPPCFNGKF